MMLVKLANLAFAFVVCGLKVQGSSAAFSPDDQYLIACGSTENVSVQGQIFIPDSHQSSVLLKSEGNVAVSSSNSTAPSPIYHSLRIFTKPSSYQFNIREQGQHWIRLYFHPLPNSGHDLNSTLITVITEKFVLLNNFTINHHSSYLFKEYMINVASNTLTISFIPSNNSVVFVNGIEVVSVPDDLIPEHASMLSPFSSLNSLSNRALETVYRLNMGGPLLTPQNDTLGRTWENDRKYLHVNYSAVDVSVSPENITYPVGLSLETAPRLVYETAEAMRNQNMMNLNFNITWNFSVDPGFLYFVRLHFCDIISENMGQLVFNVYINSNTAIMSLDLSTETGGLSVPYYKDFIANSSTGSKTMTVSIGPDTMAGISNAILNGLEIIKISNDAGSLNGESPVDFLLPPMQSMKRNMRIVAEIVTGSLVTLGMMALCIYCFAAHGSKSKTHAHPQMSLPLYENSLASSDHRVFTFQEIMDFTNKFDESMVLGVGGFGKVYKGMLEDGTMVAIKRGNLRSQQGLAEFNTEIKTLSKLRHFHLVSLLGYCNDHSELILVYQYMANGTLSSHLYGTGLPPLSWKQRLKICIGAARGLHYLHTGAAKSIIHRDVKTANILLDENFVAKVADFGISKTIPTSDQTHVSTTVKGSFGYFDPEYFRKQQLTLKSDVYSFGVVLMEVLYARPALNMMLPIEQANIVDWGRKWKEKGMLDQVIDPFLVGRISLASLQKFHELTEKCLAEKAVERPNIGDVLWNLECILRLEEMSTQSNIR